MDKEGSGWENNLWVKRAKHAVDKVFRVGTVVTIVGGAMAGAAPKETEARDIANEFANPNKPAMEAPLPNGYKSGDQADLGPAAEEFKRISSDVVHGSTSEVGKTSIPMEETIKKDEGPVLDGPPTGYDYWYGDGRSGGYYDPENGVLVGPPPSAEADARGYHGGCETHSCYLAPDGKWYQVGEVEDKNTVGILGEFTAKSILSAEPDINLTESAVSEDEIVNLGGKEATIKNVFGAIKTFNYLEDGRPVSLPRLVDGEVYLAMTFDFGSGSTVSQESIEAIKDNVVVVLNNGEKRSAVKVLTLRGEGQGAVTAIFSYPAAGSFEVSFGESGETMSMPNRFPPLPQLEINPKSSPSDFGTGTI